MLHWLLRIVASANVLLHFGILNQYPNPLLLRFTLRDSKFTHKDLSTNLHVSSKHYIQVNLLWGIVPRKKNDERNSLVWKVFLSSSNTITRYKEEFQRYLQRKAEVLVDLAWCCLDKQAKDQKKVLTLLVLSKSLAGCFILLLLQFKLLSNLDFQSLSFVAWEWGTQTMQPRILAINIQPIVISPTWKTAYVS